MNDVAESSLGQKVLRKALTWTLGLYSIAVLTTMAGMEIFGWLSATLTLIGLLFFRSEMQLPKPLLQRLDWVFIGLASVIIVSAYFAVPEDADRFFIAGNSRFVFLFLLLRIGVEIVGTDKIEKMVPWLVGITFFIGLYAIFQNVTGIDLIRGHRNPIAQETLGGVLTYRARGMWDHPVRFGHSIALTLCLPISYFLASRFHLKDLGAIRSAWMPVLFFLAILSAALGLFFSHTRGAWLGMVAAILGMSFYAGRAIFFKSVAAISACAVIVLTSSLELRGRFISMLQPKADGSSMARLDIWRANFEMFLDHPIIGVGYGANEALIGSYYQKLGIVQSDGGHAHNNFIQMLSGTGIFGFGLYVAFAVLVWIWTHKLISNAKEAGDKFLLAVGLTALGAQLVIHVGGLTECSFKSAQINHQYLFLLAVMIASTRHSRSFNWTEKWGKKWN